MKVRFSEDKPHSCRHCYFWNSRKKKCKFDSCYYLVPEVGQTVTMCSGCPYGRVRPCIGWCTRLILKK